MAAKVSRTPPEKASPADGMKAKLFRITSQNDTDLTRWAGRMTEKTGRRTNVSECINALLDEQRQGSRHKPYASELADILSGAQHTEKNGEQR